jgi:translation initiation factor 3 subunit C
MGVIAETVGCTCIVIAGSVVGCRYQEKTPEQEKLERRRQMPFHMHINLEMVEAVYLTCAALLEGPNMAAHPLASQRRVISRPFLRLLETYKNQVCFGV